MTKFIFLGSRITVESVCSLEIKRCLLLGRKAITKLDSIFRSRDTNLHKCLFSQSCGFSSSCVWIWKLDHIEGSVPKNWCFKLWCWRRRLRVPWTARKLKQSILEEINPECSLEGLMLKLQYLATWWEEMTHWKRPWHWERLRAREEATEDEMVGWHHWLNGHEWEETPADTEGQGRLACCIRWGSKETDMTWRMATAWALPLGPKDAGCSNSIQALQKIIELVSQLNFFPVDLESEQLQNYPCDYLPSGEGQ